MVRFYRMTPGQLQAGLVMTFMVAVVALVMAGLSLQQQVDTAVQRTEQNATRQAELKRATCDFIALFGPDDSVGAPTTDRAKKIATKATVLFNAAGCGVR